MAVDLGDYIDSLKRAVIPLGSTLFSTVTPTMWTAYMSDAFWQARLDGFMLDYSADEDGIVTNDTGGDELGREYVSLIVLYAGITVLYNKILNTNTGFRAKAGPVEFEQQNSATVLAEMLKQLREAKDRILEQVDGDETNALVLDALSVRLLYPGSYWGSPELTG